MADNFRVILISGWVCNPRTDGWGPWLIKELEDDGLEVIIQSTPHLARIIPQRRKAVAQLHQQLPKPGRKTIVLAHSFGAAIAMRYVSDLSEQIEGMVLISPLYRWAFKPWLPLWREPFNVGRLRRNCRRIQLIHSKDDYLVPFQNSSFLAYTLGCRLLALENRGHFAPRDRCFEFPEALNAVLDLRTP